MDEYVVQITDANIHQDDSLILSDINFTISKGEFVYLIGRTGSGKSSLLKTLYADHHLTNGYGVVCGYNIHQLKRRQIPLLRRKVGIIFQDFELFTDRSVQENLEFVLKATGWTSKAKVKKRISEVLMRVGLESSASKMPHQLSGGEQQRIVIARALLNEPLLLVADEPTGNLDPEVSESILKLFIDINNSGTSVIMATHDHKLIEKFPFRTLSCEGQAIKDSHNAASSYTATIS